MMVKMTEHGFWSHDIQNHHLLARGSKRLIRNFRPWGGQNEWNFQVGYFRDHWHHVPEQTSLSRSKIWKFDPFCRTSKCDPRFRSHASQKDRIKIFGRGAAKMGEMSRRDTFETTVIMFRSEILSPGQKFGNLTYFIAPQMRSQVLVARWSKRPNRNFQPWGGQNGWNFQENITGGKHSGLLPSSSEGKYSLQWKILEIWPIWFPIGQKDRTEIFGQYATQMRKNVGGSSVALKQSIVEWLHYGLEDGFLIDFIGCFYSWHAEMNHSGPIPQHNTSTISQKISGDLFEYWKLLLWPWAYTLSFC